VEDGVVVNENYVRESVEREFNLTPEQLDAPVDLKCKQRLFPIQSEHLSDIAESNRVLSEVDKQITAESIRRLWAKLDEAYRNHDAPPGYVNITNEAGDGGFLVPEDAPDLIEALRMQLEDPKPDCVVQE
jgi:hypothetical protein